jgi:phage-related minor tail protein
MTLQERCRDVGIEIEHRNKLRRDEKEADAFRQRLQDLRSIREDVTLQLEKVKTLRSKDVSVVETGSQSAALAVLKEWEKNFIADPTETIKDYSRLKRSFDKVRKDVTQAVQTALDGVDRDLPTIDESFLRQVEAIPSYAAQVTRIRERRDVLKGKDVHSMTANELEQFLGRRDDLRKLADLLNPKEFPKDVLDFFKAARRGGASLDQFTASVQKWLADRSQLKNVRIIVTQS